MPSDSGATTPVWTATADLPTYDALNANVTADVCIVGAGIAGLSVAYHLAREGRSVVVLDDGPVGGGESGRTTAHLSNAFDDRYFEVARMHGEETARLVAESHTAAIDRIEEIVRREHIACDFQRLDGYLFLAPGDEGDLLARELDASHQAGLALVDEVDDVRIGASSLGPALRFPRQGQFHIGKYLSGLARAIERLGGRIYTQTHATDFETDPQIEVRTANEHTVTASALVVATNSPVNDWIAMHTKQAPYRTYVIGARVKRGDVPTALYWDTGDPYHYVRLMRGSSTESESNEAFGNDDVLIVGGEDHKTGQAEDTDARFERLDRWMRERFPMAGEVAYRWSGQVMEPIDYLGYIGRNPGEAKNVFIVTGDSGQGMTHGTIGGMLVTDLIVGRENAWERIYEPSRVTLRAAPEFVKENVNVAAQYRDYITGGDVDEIAAIRPGEGAVLRRGAHKVAVFRAEDGTVHERSAVCPHLYCIVHWNGTERSWDCPCHGSRFDAYGRVINGPALNDLAMVEDGAGASSERRSSPDASSGEDGVASLPA